MKNITVQLDSKIRDQFRDKLESHFNTEALKARRSLEFTFSIWRQCVDTILESEYYRKK